MKSLITITSLFISLTVLAQTKDEFEVVSLGENQKFNLNSQSRIGGTTRSHLFVNLPPNTVSWIYMLTTRKSATPAILNLMPQVLKLIDKTGLTSALTSSLTFPSGESTINTYVIPQDQFSNFINNKEFNYYPPASRMAFNSGPVKVDYPFNSGQYYIAIENPAAVSAVSVTIDVVAIVKKNNTAAPTNNSQDKKTGLPAILETIQKSLDKPTNQNSDSNTRNVSPNENSNPGNNNSASTQNDSVSRKRNQALNIGNLGWYAYERGDITACIEQSKKSISIYPLFFAEANLALCYLVQGNDSLAMEQYVNALDVLINEPNQKKSIQAAIKDIEDAKGKRKLNPIAEDILKLLISKL